MGNAFWNAPIGSDDSSFELWHVLIVIGGLWFLKKLVGGIAYHYRVAINQANAKKMLTERNAKTFEFKHVDASELKSMDVT